MDIMIILLLLLFFVFITFAFWLGLRAGAFKKDREWLEQLPGLRKDAIKQSRAVLGGQFSEQIAPFLPDFPHSPTEVRFIGKPIDFLVFKGMDEKNISEVVFVEVKSGRSKMDAHELRLKDAIDNRRVRWEEYRIPEEITKEKHHQ